VFNPLIEKEKDMFYGWLIKTLDEKKSIKINIEELINFYQEKFKSFSGESISA